MALASGFTPNHGQALNSKHVVDLYEIGGDTETGGDILTETKVPSPTISSYCAGKGSKENGGNAASVGPRYGFGNTEEKYRVKVFGCKERGRPRDGPLDHSTGKGWVKHVEGDYPDRHAKGSRLDIILLESYGGASPHTRAIVRRYARHASAKGVTDRTKYGATRASPKSFYNHHMQRLVKAAVVGDAKNIRMQVNCHRQWLHHWATA